MPAVVVMLRHLAAQVWQIPVVAADAATVMALPMPGDLAALEW